MPCSYNLFSYIFFHYFFLVFYFRRNLGNVKKTHLSSCPLWMKKSEYSSLYVLLREVYGIIWWFFPYWGAKFFYIECYKAIFAFVLNFLNQLITAVVFFHCFNCNLFCNSLLTFSRITLLILPISFSTILMHYFQNLVFGLLMLKNIKRPKILRIFFLLTIFLLCCW